MQITNTPNLKTRTNVVRNAETDLIDSDGVESETVREVMDGILSDKRLHIELIAQYKRNGDVIPM